MSPDKTFEFAIGRFRFRPTWRRTIFVVPAIVILFGLGTWQVERLQWKLGLIHDRETRSTAPAMAPPASAEDIAEIEFRKVALAGRFLNDREMYLAARSLRGNLGYHVVTPFIGGDGEVTLVDRGWVPLDRKEPKSREAGEIEGTTTIEGLIRKQGRPGWFVPDNQPGKNFWFFVDIPAMAGHAGLAKVRPYFVEAGPGANPGGLPIGGQSQIELPNNHLSYAITWYSLSLGLLIIFLIYHRVKPE